jgi:DNA-binding NtrC family response regulator
MFRNANALKVNNFPNLKVLIIEDDEIASIALREQLENFFKQNKMKSEITTVEDEISATRVLTKNYFDIAFFDLQLKEGLEGLDLLQKYNSKVAYPVILSSRDEKSVIDKGEKAGCKDFLSKPFMDKSISYLYNRYITSRYAENDNQIIFSNFITDDSYTKEQLLKIPMLRNNKNSVYLCGPTGTGKQVIAELIYKLIWNSRGNFIDENCASIPSGLEESHLFGHKKGAFTDAREDRKGLFELARSGVLFLDEIGKLSYQAQGKLLKVLEQKKYRPLGGEVEKEFNGMIITASCEDLQKMVKAGAFREDLYARITGVEINIKPLKKRRNDIMLIINYYLNNHESGRKIEISKEAEKFLINYDWPENVREIVKEVDKWHSRGLINLRLEHLKHLEEKHIKNNYKYLTDEAIKDSIELGFAGIMKAFGRELFKYHYQKTGRKVRQTIKLLGTSVRQFYNYIEKGLEED